MSISRLSSRRLSIASVTSSFTSTDVNSDAIGDLSTAEIKRLFFIWFISISTDNKSLTFDQFSTVLNRIFSSTPLSQSKISDIFNTLNIDDNECIHFNEFLSENEDTFGEWMCELLQTDSTAKTILVSVPRVSKNNPINDTLQQILHDQTKEWISLKNWVISYALPSQHCFTVENRLLQDELSMSLDDSKRMNMKLQLMSEIHDNINDDKNVITQDYSKLHNKYVQTTEENSILKSINEASVAEIKKINVDIDRISQEFDQQKQKNKELQIVIQSLTTVNNQLTKAMEQLRNRYETQNKENKRLSNINNQVEKAMEMLTNALDQKTEEFEALQRKRAQSDITAPVIPRMLTNRMMDTEVESERDLLQNMDSLKLDKQHSYPSLPSMSNAHRRSYVFTMNDPNLYDCVTEHSRARSASPQVPNAYNLSPSNSAHRPKTPTLPRRQSILSIGGGHKMNVYNSNKLLDLDEKGDYKRLYHDENTGVGLYVCNTDFDNSMQGLFTYSMEENVTENDYDMSEDNIEEFESVGYDFEDNENIKLNEMKIIQNLEMIKLKQELDEMIKQYNEISDDSTDCDGLFDCMEFKLNIKGKHGIFDVDMLMNDTGVVIEDKALDKANGSCQVKGKIMSKSENGFVLNCKIKGAV